MTIIYGDNAMPAKTCPPRDQDCDQGRICPAHLAMHRMPAPFEPVWYQHHIAAMSRPAATAQPVPCSTLVRWALWVKRFF